MRILLVEDDPTTSRSIELMLTHANLNVYCTDLGEDGIDLAIGGPILGAVTYRLIIKNSLGKAAMAPCK